MKQVEVSGQIKAYCAARDKVLLTRDPRQMIALLAKYHNDQLPSLEVAEITMHKMTTAIRSMPMALRTESKRWLLERGYQPYDDGDVPT
jgi:hypothetical protein